MPSKSQLITAVNLRSTCDELKGICMCTIQIQMLTDSRQLPKYIVFKLGRQYRMPSVGISRCELDIRLQLDSGRCMVFE